jgi:hypothetical protein
MPGILYDATKKLIIENTQALQRILSDCAGPFYVYVLCVPPVARRMRPFYVGVGQSHRIFSHEDIALKTSTGRKSEEIRRIWDSNQEVVRVIDGFFEQEPWRREEELINRFGLVKDGTGILMNEQRYSPSRVQDGVELRKYAREGNNLPANFIHRETRLIVGPCIPKSDASVYGKICKALERNPGATGEELVELLLDVDFSGNKSAYTKGGAVSRPWLAKYIDGGFYAKNRYIQEAGRS